MRRILLLTIIVILLFAVLGMGVGLSMSQDGPFQPGDPLFPYQHFAEQQRAGMIADPAQRVIFLAQLASQRAEDLILRAGTPDEELALSYLNQAFDQVLQALRSAPVEALPMLEAHLLEMAGKIDMALAESLTPSPALSQLRAAFAAFQGLLAAYHPVNSPALNSQGLALGLPPGGGNTGSSANPVDFQYIDPHAVSFPAGSSAAVHAFFPLTGKHATVACGSCHTQGRYAGTARQCAACHGDEKPASHYAGDCAACHTTASWRPAQFNHSLAIAKDCQACHARNKPANHYAGQCSSCHNTDAWKPARFNHRAAGATNCASCHNPPRNHYSGQCSSCHSTEAWKPARFNHQAAGATDCISCHNSPKNHYTEQCSSCHNTDTWKPAHFNHQAVGATDCASCHNPPRNHYSGQCSSCHNTNAWKPASFNHQAVGATDCASCHNPPRNHYAGQCSQCHTTDNWRNIRVEGHTFPLNHGGAHGACSRCHTGGSNSVNCYTCHDQQKTEKHHAEKNILDIAGKCLGCHPNGKKN